VSRGQNDFKLLKKAQASIPKLASPVSPTDKANLSKMVNAVIPAAEHALKVAVQLKKDENILRALKKKGASDAQLQKYADEHMKYRAALIKEVYKISEDLGKASDLSERIQKEMKDKKQDKLAKELETLTNDLWSVSQEYGTYTRWKEEAVD